MNDPLGRAGQRFPPGAMSGKRLRQLGTAAVSVAQGHNLEVAGKHAGQLDGGLVGLRAAIAEISLADLSGRDLCQFFRNGHHRFVGEQ